MRERVLFCCPLLLTVEKPVLCENDDITQHPHSVRDTQWINGAPIVTASSEIECLRNV